MRIGAKTQVWLFCEVFYKKGSTSFDSHSRHIYSHIIVKLHELHCCKRMRSEERRYHLVCCKPVYMHLTVEYKIHFKKNKKHSVINLVKGVSLFYLHAFFNLINYKGCEIDVEMTDQSYHQKTEIENVLDETKSDTEV